LVLVFHMQTQESESTFAFFKLRFLCLVGLEVLGAHSHFVHCRLLVLKTNFWFGGRFDEESPLVVQYCS